MLLRDVLKEYKFDCKARKLSVKTIDGYMRMNGYLFDYLEQKHGIYDVEQVRASHIKQFLLLKEEMGTKPQYINDLLKVFKCYFKYCVDEEYYIVFWRFSKGQIEQNELSCDFEV